jgi:pentatricopeptide repeat protein
MTTVKVFVSYSWDTEEHKTRVLELSNTLRKHGIDAELDQYHSNNPWRWARWCEDQIESSDFVLMICTSTYKERIEHPENNPKEGLGVCWEADYIYDDLYDNKGYNEKYLPILLDEHGRESIPKRLRGYTNYKLLRPYSQCNDFQGLLNRLKGINRTSKPPLGTPHDWSVPEPSCVDPYESSDIPAFRNLQRETDDNEELPRSSTLLRLRFADRAIEYFRQEEVWQVFEGFYTSLPPFSWWLITGDAGTGKSRTALEFCEYLKQKNWCAEFVNLNETSRDVWRAWRPKQDTLLVIDYVAREFSSNPRSIARIFTLLSRRAERCELGNKRLRILLLEREYLERSEVGQPLEWYRWLDTKMCYQPPFNLGIVSDEGLYSIAKQTAKDIWNSSGPLPIASDFLNELAKLDEKKRPLFAILLAGYLAETHQKKIIGRNDVLDYAIDREFERFLTPAGIKEDPARLNALLLSTCTGGKLGTCLLPDDHRLWNSGLGDRREGNDETRFFFHPIEPDLLGERFVLNCDNRHNKLHIDKNQLKKLLQICWQDAPLKTADFFDRCAQDFASTDSDKITDLFRSSMPTTEENSPFQKIIGLLRASVVVNLISYFGSAGNITEAQKLFEDMPDTDTPEIALERAKAAFNLINGYLNAGNITGVRKLFEDMPDADTPEITLVRAKAAFNLIIGYCSAENITEAQKLFEDMPDADTPEIALVRAQAAINLITGYLLAGNITEARKLFEDMPNADTPEIALERAAAAFNLITGYCRAENITEARKLFEDMPDADTPEIALKRAKAAFNLINGYCRAENITEARKLFEDMPDADTPEIALERA